VDVFSGSNILPALKKFTTGQRHDNRLLKRMSDRKKSWYSFHGQCLIFRFHSTAVSRLISLLHSLLGPDFLQWRPIDEWYHKRGSRSVSDNRWIMSDVHTKYSRDYTNPRWQTFGIDQGKLFTCSGRSDSQEEFWYLHIWHNSDTFNKLHINVHPLHILRSKAGAFTEITLQSCTYSSGISNSS